MRYFFLIVSIIFFENAYGQVNDSIKNLNHKKLTFQWKQLIIPTALIGYGVVGIESDLINNFDDDINEELEETIDDQFTIDDFSTFVPAASVYALNLFGVKGKNNFKDRTIILSTATLIMGTSVLTLKSVTNVQRPDGTSEDSFPSGHTAVAFMGAEFLWQEYKEVSVWYGISGYAIALGTGFFRMYNNRHWLTDVAAGAGIGILSTKIAYWMYPLLNSKLFKSENSNSAHYLTPFFMNKQYGLSFIKQF